MSNTAVKTQNVATVNTAVNAATDKPSKAEVTAIIDGLTMTELLSGRKPISGDRVRTTGSFVGVAIIDRYRVGNKEINVAKIYSSATIYDSAKREDPKSFFIVGYFRDDDSDLTTFNGCGDYRGIPTKASGELIEVIEGLIKNVKSKMASTILERQKQNLAKKQAKTDELFKAIMG